MTKQTSQKAYMKAYRANYKRTEWIIPFGPKTCTKCHESKDRSEFSPELLKKDALKSQCKACTRKSAKKYREGNSAHINKLNRASTAKRRATDPLYAMTHRLRARGASAFKNASYTKTTKTAKTIGASFEVVQSHITSLFTKGMTWQNRSLWHLDHIIPLASANNKEELEALCHYTNLQPLWAMDNLRKSDKMPHEL
jgi:hypothetical protein